MVLMRSLSSAGWGNSTLITFQFIASGLLGPSAFRSGWSSASLGLVCHFVIAISAAAAYFVLTRMWPWLLRRPIFYGPVFGLGVFLFMHYVIVPLSAVPRPSTTPFEYIRKPGASTCFAWAFR